MNILLSCGRFHMILLDHLDDIYMTTGSHYSPVLSPDSWTYFEVVQRDWRTSLFFRPIV